MDAAHSRRVLRLLPGIGALVLLGSLVLAETPAPTTAGTTALVGGRILTQTDAGAVEGVVLIRDGTIVAVGRDVPIPVGANRIDITGQVVTPGLIDARSTLGLSGAEGRESASDGSLNVLDGIDPHHEDWKEVLRQGVTAVYVQPSSSGLLGGQGAVLRVGPARTVEDLVIKSSAGAQAALGVAGGSSPTPTAPAGLPRRGRDGPTAQPDQPAPSGGGNTSLTRFAQYEQLKRAFEAARKYDEERTKLEEADRKQGTTKAGRGDPTRNFLRQVVKGDVPLRLEAHREDDIRHALRLADELRLRVIFDGVCDPGLAAESLVGRKLPLVLGPFVELESPPAYRKNRPADWPRMLLTPDTRWALGTFSSQPRGSRLLRVHAAEAIARGIEPDRVLRAMTRDAAELLGLGERLGTIAPGKQADLVVFSGDPLDPSVPVRLVLSAGKVVFEENIPVEAIPKMEPPNRVTEAELPVRLPKKYALRTQRLIGDDGVPRPGLVLVDSGKVVGLGAEVAVGEGVPTYDLGSAVLTPGLVAGPNTLGASEDAVEADAGQVRAADDYNPEHRQVRALLEGGFTQALLTPGSVNVIGGTASGVRLGLADPVFGDAALKLALTNSARTASRTTGTAPAGFGGRSGGPGRYPGSLAGQIELIEQVLGGKGPTTELYLPRRISEQIQVERRRQAAALRERKLVACIEARTRAEVAAALQLIDQFELRGVLIGPEEITPFLDDLRRLKVGIVARPLEQDDYDRAAVELARTAPAGVPIAFGSGTAQELRLTASLAVNAGMPREAAWRGLTTTSAEMLGLPADAGKLIVGGPADLAVWTGSPLDLRSRALRVVVDGKIVYAAQ